MLYSHEKLDKIVEDMRSFGEYLVPYNFPRVTQKDEDEINILKTRDAVVDGYNVIVSYSKNEYPDHYQETIQILGKYAPFLPFHLVCKLAQRFLGDRHLSLVELFRDNRKIYCWTLNRNVKGEPIPTEFKETEAEECSFEGFRYYYMNPNTVNFY